MKKIVLFLTLTCSSFTAFGMEEPTISIQPAPQTMEIEEPLIQRRHQNNIRGAVESACLLSCLMGIIVGCKILYNVTTS
ncbi:MAG: hypothetical protein ACHQVS_05010 [Candidatus Babeliales bacterium]